MWMFAVLGTWTRYHSQVEGHPFHIPDIPNSNIGRETRYPEVLPGFVDFSPHKYQINTYN